MNEEGVRLAKRVAAMLPCSRAEAERYIAGGWVTVDGEVTEDPATRVGELQQVVLLDGATAVDLDPVTILLHKPAGVDAVAALALITPDNQEGRERFLKRHMNKLTHILPLETAASGLLIFTQHGGLARKLTDKTQPYEQEYLVDVSGQMPEGGLALLNRGLKVSWQTPTRLRFAGKGIVPGQVEKLSRSMGLNVTAIRRTRIGRIAASGLQSGQWRYLGERERF